MLLMMIRATIISMSSCHCCDKGPSEKKGKDGAPAAIILDFVKTILFALLECANFLSRKSKPSCIFQLEPHQQRQQDFQKVVNLY